MLLFVDPKPTTEFICGVTETAGWPSTFLRTKVLEIPQNLRNMLVSRHKTLNTSICINENIIIYKDKYTRAIHERPFKLRLSSWHDKEIALIIFTDEILFK
jgi:hypothetical protein